MSIGHYRWFVPVAKDEKQLEQLLADVASLGFEVFAINALDCSRGYSVVVRQIVTQVNFNQSRENPFHAYTEQKPEERRQDPYVPFIPPKQSPAGIREVLSSPEESAGKIPSVTHTESRRSRRSKASP